MTDPIRIPIGPIDHMLTDGVILTPDHIAAIAHAIAADPVLARKIVAAGAGAMPTCEPAQADADAPPVADDDAAVNALSDLLLAAGWRPTCDAQYSNLRDQVIPAIKAGKVPGICTTAERDKALADLAAMTERAEKAEEDARLAHAQKRKDCIECLSLDKAQARATSIEQTMREALAFIATCEPDNYARTSVQHMLSFAERLTGTAQRALEKVQP